MKRIIFIIAFVCAWVIHVSAQTVIYGSMVDNNSWSQWDKEPGIYSFSPVAGTQITPVFIDGYDLNATGGGVLVDNVYHLFSHREGGGTWFSVSYSAYNIENWNCEDSCYFIEMIASNDMTYDPVSDRVFCAQKGTSSRKLLKWDPSNIDDIEEMGDLAVEIVAIAADAEGMLYGVGTDGAFYSIDKTDASLAKIGDTGVSPRGYQSAVFDFSTGNLYWAAYTSGGKSALYTINVETGAATKITDFADNARFCGLYTLATTTSPSAPAAVDDLSITFPSGCNSGTATFTLPSLTFGGAPLAGSLQYCLEADGAVVVSGTGQAGAPVSLDMTMTTGFHNFILVTSNAAGESPRTKLTVYVGKGIPGSVDHARALPTSTPGMFEITWDAPQYWYPEEAYFNPSELRYSVVRMPGNVMVADHIAECIATDQVPANGPLTAYHYEITAHIDDINSVAATTNGVSAGSPIEPPYEVSMAQADLAFFTIIDANHDGSSWGKDWYGYGVSCGGRWEGDCDDWLILPPLYLEGGGMYSAIVNVGNDYDGPSRWEIKIGKAPMADAMTGTIMSPASTVTNFDGEISVDESGTYYIGIHCIGSAGSTMYLTDIIVHGLAGTDAPDMPSDVSGVGAPKGELAAEITFTTPTRSIGGDVLESLSSVNIYRGETLVYTLGNVEPGKEYTCKVKAEQEFNNYSIAAVNSHGEGRRARVDYVFAGLDYPAVPTGVALSETDNLIPVVTWDAPSETGLYGFYVNPDEVTYEIYRSYGDNNFDLVEENFHGTEFVDSSLDLDRDQFLLSYSIYPVNSIGRGYGAASNVMCVGRPYEAPYQETFKDGSVDTNPWYYSTNAPQNCGWNIFKVSDTTLPDYDGSDGIMAFYATNPGEEATLYAPYISVKGLDNPILDFYYFEDANTLDVTVKANDLELPNSILWADEDGWHRFMVALAPFTGDDRVKLEFCATADPEHSYAFLDNVRVREMKSHDLAVGMPDVPAEMSLGKECTVKVTVKNDGEETSHDALLVLSRNGFEVDRIALPSIKAAARATFSFSQIPDVTFGETPEYTATVIYDLDEDATNDTSSPVYTRIPMPRYPAPDGLRAIDSPTGVELTWERPTATSMAPDPLTEDFEGFEAFAIEMHPWKLVDGDGCATAIMWNPESWTDELDYPHKGEPMAYQIFDPRAVGIDTSEWISYTPWSGSNAAVCWSTADWDVANDDWLISPRLYPGGQTISFMVYSRTGYFDNEKYEVLYSSTNDDPDSFTLIESGVATDEWTCVSVVLPSDARYFAIRTVSSQSNTETWYDDIRYIPYTFDAIPLDLMGFNVYRDNVRINTELVAEPAFTDVAVAAGRHKYNVTAVYGVGESQLSEDAIVDATGFSGSLSAGNVRVIGDRGFIMVTGAEGRNVAIVNAAGITIRKSAVNSDDYRISLLPGTYLVTIADATFKVLVR